MRLAPIAALLTALFPTACSRPPGEARSRPPAGGPGTGVVAEVDGSVITREELDRQVEGRLTRLQQEEYEMRRAALEELMTDRLIEAEARRRGLSREVLVRQEVDGRTASPAPGQAELIYDQNRERFSGRTREQAVAEIREALARRLRSERRAQWEEELRKQATVVVRLEPPRAEVPIPAGEPATGTAGARVTIVEFTDYQCPFCHRAQGVMDQILSRYEGKIRLVHRDFPLEGHPGAFPAARAARCAGEQGRFWAYHRNLMTVAGALDDADLMARAKGLRLDAGAFGACLGSDRHDASIRAAYDDGVELGVTGTPAYFINGRMLSGARPLAAFAEVIDEELARAP